MDIWVVAVNCNWFDGWPPLLFRERVREESGRGELVSRARATVLSWRHCCPEAGALTVKLGMQWGGPGVRWAGAVSRQEPNCVNMVLNAVQLLLGPQNVSGWDNCESGLSRGAHVGTAPQRRRALSGIGLVWAPAFTCSLHWGGRLASSLSRLPVCPPFLASSRLEAGGCWHSPLLYPWDCGGPGKAGVASISGGRQKGDIVGFCTWNCFPFPFSSCAKLN